MNLANNSKASTEIYNISVLATQCPREGGAPVYRARTLMYTIDKTIHYNDDTQCNTIALRKGAKHIYQHTYYRMIPDKLNHILKFNSDNDTESTLIISVYDLQGRCVQQTVTSGKNSVYSINFNQQSEQFYLVKLVDEKNYEKAF